MLGDFFYQYDDLVMEGLLGGVLSTAWPLGDLEGRRPRLDYRGLKKVNDQELLELRYRMRKGGGDFNINLYFDPETFRHLPASTNSESALPWAGHPGESARQVETRLTLEEWFGDFQTRQGLDLPSHWTIRYTIGSPQGTRMSKWDTLFNRTLHSMPINPQLFVLH